MVCLAGQKCTLCLNKGVLIWRGDTIPLLDKEGRVFANNVQLLQPTTLPPGEEALVCERVVLKASGPVGLVENTIHDDTGFGTLCWAIQSNQYSCVVLTLLLNPRKFGLGT